MTSKKNTELTAGANSAQGFHDFFCMIKIYKEFSAEG